MFHPSADGSGSWSSAPDSFMSQMEGLRPPLAVSLCALTNEAHLDRCPSASPLPTGEYTGVCCRGEIGQLSASIEYPGLVTASSSWVGFDSTPGHLLFCLRELCIPSPGVLKVCSKSGKSLSFFWLQTWAGVLETLGGCSQTELLFHKEAG